MGKIVMAYWDCPFCGSTGIQGNVSTCPNCGRARGEVKFYMKDHGENAVLHENQRGDIEYVDEEQAKYVNRNPDWYCSYCNALNSDNAANCQNCGASRTDSESNYFEMLKKKEAREQQNAAAQPAPARSNTGSKRPLIFLLIAAVAIFGLVRYLTGNQTRGDLKVSSISWVRSINVEQNREYQEADWQLPNGATLISQEQALHHYDTVLDHYESVPVTRTRQVLDHYESYYTYNDMGNGYYEEVEHEKPVYRTEEYTDIVQQPVYIQVPRYATRYHYSIWRWTPSRDVQSSGSDHNAYWPEVTYAADEREGKKTEVYRMTVTGEKDGSSATYRLAEADWRNVNTGTGIYITASRMGGHPCISDKDGNRIADLIPE